MTSQNALKRAFAVVAAGAALVLPAMVLLNLHRGVEFSDAGYYFINTWRFAEVDGEVTQFGVVWRLLPLPESIYWNRVALLFLLLGAGGFLAHAAWSLVWPGAARRLWDRLPVWSFGAGGAALYYFGWIPDPSYNSIALLLSMLLTAMSFRIAAQLRAAGDVAMVNAVIAGGLLLMLAVARQPTALVMAALLPLVVVALGRPSFRVIVRLAAGGLLGGALYVVLTSLLVEPFTTTLGRMLNGLAFLEDGGHDYHSLHRAFWAGVGGVVWAHKIAFAGLTAGLMFACWGRLFDNCRYCAALGAVLPPASLFLMLGDFLIGGQGFERIDMQAMANVLFAFSPAVAVAALFAGAVSVWRPGAIDFKPFSVTIMALLGAWFAQFFLTSNAWHLFASYTAVFPVLALLLASARIEDGAVTWRAGAAICLALALHGAVWRHAEAKPYRLAAPLSGQTLATPLRDGAEKIYTDEKTHALLNALSEAARKMGPVDERPVLIDMSGRAPFVNYHMQAPVPGKAWLLSGYAHSQAVFDTAVMGLDDEAFNRAWILDAPDYRRRHAPDAIAARGRDLERDYTIVFEGYFPYPGATFVLRRPN